MRAPLLIVGLLLLIVAGSYGVQHALESSSKKLSIRLEKVRKEIVAGDRTAVQRSIAAIDKEWHKVEGGWGMITDHREMDEIDMTLVRMDSFVRQGQIPLALTELSTMQRLIKHIPEKEEFNLRNVL